MATKLTAAEKAKIEAAAISTVESRAFNAGEARAALLASVASACGAKPNLVLFEKVRLGAVVGFMASALARKGDNRTEQVLRAHCRDRLLNYQGAGGKAPLKSGKKGRRTQEEEDAYSSARTLASRLWADAGVKVPPKSGTNSNTKETVQAKAQAKGKKGATGKRADKPANDAKPAVHTFKSPEKVAAYALVQAKAMQSTLNKSAAHAPERLGTAINHFLSEVLAVCEELGIAS